MKIVIYGDSFADYRYRPNNKKTWIHYLEDSLGHRVTCFSNSGSGFYFSVKNYLETGKDFDKKIFLVTFPGRLYVPHNETDRHHIPGYAHAKFVADITTNYTEKKIYNAAAEYFTYVQNYEEECFKQYCILDRIKTDNNLLLIPCGPDSMENYSGPFLREVSHIDYHYYRIRTDAERKDLRCCHMNNQNNITFAKLVYEWLITEKFNLNFDNFVTPIELENDLFDKKLYI